MRNPRPLLFCAVILIFVFPALAQQTDISKYTLFTGFDYMISPARNLTERGFEADFGVTMKPWLALGGDFGALGADVISGAGTINGSETIYAPLLTGAESLGAPPPNTVHVPFKSTTYTFAVGPQFYLRKWERFTLFARPGFGGIHENANFSLPPQLGLLLQILGANVPAAHQTDTTIFFGLGGGFDVKVNRRVGVRFATDWVNTHLFSNLLTQRQNYVRFSVGPVWHWGKF
jgi:hypothetical protein